ncbi:MAG: FG-GAP repeat domain-containing protein [Pseudomonadota bacterium]
MLANDYAVGKWEAFYFDGASETRLASTVTTLPPAHVFRDGTRTVAKAALPASAPLSLLLQAVDGNGDVLGTYADTQQIPVALAASSSQLTWRWTVRSGAVDFYSAAGATTTGFKEEDLGFWGAMAVGDLGDGQNTVLGVSSPVQGDGYARYQALGLGSLFEGRDFRDVRIVDLNNDGLNDIVANVYGSGCTVIGLRQPQGGYDLRTPALADGSCIGGHGETILVADFDQDGLVDIFLPSYESFVLLRNRGSGSFEDVSLQAGINYPNYLPHVEGAAAVDVNLDGAVDIVVANEVLINDGTGRFSPRPQPFGAVAVFDEGMSVGDFDSDGFYDIVKNDPLLGPRVFWGNADRQTFLDSGWVLGGNRVFTSSFGITVGDFTGSGFSDLVLAGGAPAGLPPVVCAQIDARRFDCMKEVFQTHAGSWQDLLLATDLDADGAADLVARYGTLRTYLNQTIATNVFRFDLRDSQGRRTKYGASLRALCAADRSLVGLKFVDGGNGYMAQGDYVVPFTSTWCRSVLIEVWGPEGVREFGPFNRGTNVVRL